MPDTVKVRIAVVTTADGLWNPAGWLNGTDKGMGHAALGGMPACVTSGVQTQLSFVEAEVPLPVALTVEGEVEGKPWTRKERDEWLLTNCGVIQSADIVPAGFKKLICEARARRAEDKP